jgi:hypothetical protein
MSRRLEERLSAALLCAMLACVESWYVVTKVIQPNIPARIQFANAIFAGTMRAPYQYRVLKHFAAQAIAGAIEPLVGRDAARLHEWSYGLLVLFVFAAFFGVFYAFLRRYYVRSVALLGIVLFALLIPLSVTGYVVEGDFITLLAYTLGFWLMARKHDWAVPIVILVASFNRDQAAYLAVFHALFLLTQRRLWPGVLSLLASAGAWVFVYWYLRQLYGEKENPSTWEIHIERNTNPDHLQDLIVPLWISEVLFLVILAVLGWPVTNRFYRAALLALVPYVGLFFLHGHLWELAKFLPAFLVLIPVALQTLAGGRIPERMTSS